jgi:ADP-ribose pyrophosphatase
LLDDGRIVLIKQFRYATGEVLLELPAGTLEEGEDPHACAQRELQEETGWQADTLRKVGSVLTTPGFSDERIHCFVATDLRVSSDGTALDEDETIEVVTMGIEKVMDLARTGELRDAKTLATIFLARLQRLI